MPQVKLGRKKDNELLKRELFDLSASERLLESQSED